MKSIAIIGAGHSGIAMAGHLSLVGHKVSLWNRTKNNIKKLMETKEITVNGVIRGKARIETVTTDIEEAIKDAQIVFITTPASAHKDIAKLISGKLFDKKFIVLNPGRTFGAMEFMNVLQNNGCRVIPEIAETQTIIYTCRKKSLVEVDILALKKDVLISTYDNKRNQEIFNMLPTGIRKYFKPANSMVETSIGNIGMMFHCVPMILNVGWIESLEKKFNYYHEGISPTIARFIEKMDQERVHISKFLGCEVESASNWLRRTYSVRGDSLYECMQKNAAYGTIEAPDSLSHRYILEDIPCGLVPLEAVGKYIDMPTKSVSLIIDLASEIYDIDFRKEGRNLKNMETTIDNCFKEYYIA